MAEKSGSFFVFNKKPAGFTLIELVVVGIIIGLLIFVAVPMYMNARDNMERQKAIATLYNISLVEKEYGMTHIDTATGLPTYVVLALLSEGDTGLDGAFRDGTWWYTVDAGVGNFTITAQHLNGSLGEITLDQDGNFTGLP